MTTEIEDIPDPNKNDLIYETELVKVEYDKVCWGPNRWVVFARPAVKTNWRLVAECSSADEALTIAKDPERTESGDMGLTEVERIRRNKEMLAKSLPKITLSKTLKAKK